MHVGLSFSLGACGIPVSVEMGVSMDADSVVNTFSSSSLNILSLATIILSPATFLNLFIC